MSRLEFIWIRRCVLVIVISLLGGSCVSNKRINYLQNLSGNPVIELDEFIPYANVDYEYVLQPYDIIDIDFASPNEELLRAFEYQGASNARVGGRGGAGAMGGGMDVFYFSGYSLDKDGFVRIPKLGNIPLAGLTEEQARQKVEEEINRFFKEEVDVRLRIGGIRFTALGEFTSAGTKVILKNRATIFDALAMAGESNILAKKNELFIIRQYDGGTKIHQINLNDRQLLASPFYFVQNNDILYLQPMQIRQVGSGDNVSTSLQLGISIITALLFIYGVTSGIF
ncbi:MAG: polysaccharide biosynthesis/export family protein [Lunatimonas sp.]|uniref:polysaccharide biosynthesis/export family protein n=1 Tax=Lunatimonas sp. TaxID=2060141 RepID=UPI00263A96D5|nr:polysaccharide biosynthesis/export family protein [Lunatimonas sp.]MCC5935824.1 polysaccharide biosynthesis/export family protein [Lunatimonas sp.]